MRTALAKVPINVLTLKSCLRCLKNTSASHRALYNCEMVSAVQDKFIGKDDQYFIVDC